MSRHPVAQAQAAGRPQAGLRKSRGGCNEGPIGGLTVRCFRNGRRPDGLCPAHVATLVSVTMLVSAAI
jgi:hypothetical protein